MAPDPISAYLNADPLYLACVLPILVLIVFGVLFSFIEEVILKNHDDK